MQYSRFSTARRYAKCGICRRPVSVRLSVYLCVCLSHSSIVSQEALLSQRDRATRLSVEILQLQNIAIVWHYLRDRTFSRFYTILKCDRHTHTDKRTNRYTTTACIALSIASRGKNRPYCTGQWTPSIITRQRASVDSKFLGRPRNIGYYHIFEG